MPLAHLEPIPRSGIINRQRTALGRLGGLYGYLRTRPMVALYSACVAFIFAARRAVKPLAADLEVILIERAVFGFVDGQL